MGKTNTKQSRGKADCVIPRGVREQHWDPSYDPKIQVPRPRLDSMFIMRIGSERKTAAGIIIPETSQAKINVGVVYAIGSKCGEDLKLGMRVIYNFYADTEVQVEANNFIILRDSDIYGELPFNSTVFLRGEGPDVNARRKRIEREEYNEDRKFKATNEIADKIAGEKMSAAKRRQKPAVAARLKRQK
jgi:chaperonin GroES